MLESRTGLLIESEIGHLAALGVPHRERGLVHPRRLVIVTSQTDLHAVDPEAQIGLGTVRDPGTGMEMYGDDVTIAAVGPRARHGAVLLGGARHGVAPGDTRLRDAMIESIELGLPRGISMRAAYGKPRHNPHSRGSLFTDRLAQTTISISL